MEREPAFLDAIRANPQDEALRLIYADWLEEQGKSEQSSYLRLHNQLLTVIGAGQLGQAEAQRHLRGLRSNMKKLGVSIDAGWKKIFTAMEPTIFKCCVCRMPVAGKDAIATNPVDCLSKRRTQKKMNNIRYCKLCWEEVIRSYRDPCDYG